MDESDQKRKIRSMEVVSFYYDTTESHSAACEAIHVTMFAALCILENKSGK